jgi:hypothetical protein
LHKQTYPDAANPRLKVLLRSSAGPNAVIPPKEKKGAIHLRHLMSLSEALVSVGPKEDAVLDLALVAFWGLARIGKLTSPLPRGKVDPWTSFLTSNVMWEEFEGEQAIVLTLREAKTCCPSKTQEILLRPLSNMLCPVEAVKRRLIKSNGADPHFLVTTTRMEKESISQKTRSTRHLTTRGQKEVLAASLDTLSELVELQFEPPWMSLRKKSANYSRSKMEWNWENSSFPISCQAVQMSN